MRQHDILRERGNIVILYACDAHKSRSSMRPAAATDSKDALCALVAREISEGNMDYDGERGAVGLALFRSDYRGDCVDFGKLDYGFVDEMRKVPQPSHSSSALYSFYEALMLIGDEEFERRYSFSGATQDVEDETDWEMGDDD